MTAARETSVTQSMPDRRTAGGNDARQRLQVVDASFTSVAGPGLIRGRSKHCFVGARVLAVDALDEVEAEASVASIHGEIVYLRVDWATQRPPHSGRQASGDSGDAQ